MAYKYLFDSSCDKLQSWAPAGERGFARSVSVRTAQTVRATISALTVFLAIALIGSSNAVAQQKPVDPTPADFADRSLEELMNVNIYTASKRWQKIVDAPASISIVTADEIQKYGYRTLAEILRSVRGVYIGYDRNYRYIGVRGFSRPGDYNSRVRTYPALSSRMQHCLVRACSKHSTSRQASTTCSTCVIQIRLAVSSTVRSRANRSTAID